MLSLLVQIYRLQRHTCDYSLQSLVQIKLLCIEYEHIFPFARRIMKSVFIFWNTTYLWKTYFHTFAKWLHKYVLKHAQKHIFCIKLHKYAKGLFYLTKCRAVFFVLFKILKYVHVFALTNTSKYAYGCWQSIKTRIRLYLQCIFRTPWTNLNTDKYFH